MAHPKVPSNQHADYVNPLPKFHPVPTRPVFELQPAYAPLEPLPLPQDGASWQRPSKWDR